MSLTLLKSNIATENLVFHHHRWETSQPCCSDAEVYSRVCHTEEVTEKREKAVTHCLQPGSYSLTLLYVLTNYNSPWCLPRPEHVPVEVFYRKVLSHKSRHSVTSEVNLYAIKVTNWSPHPCHIILWFQQIRLDIPGDVWAVLATHPAFKWVMCESTCGAVSAAQTVH